MNHGIYGTLGKEPVRGDGFIPYFRCVQWLKNILNKKQINLMEDDKLI